MKIKNSKKKKQFNESALPLPENNVMYITYKFNPSTSF